MKITIIIYLDGIYGLDDERDNGVVAGGLEIRILIRVGQRTQGRMTGGNACQFHVEEMLKQKCDVNIT